MNGLIRETNENLKTIINTMKDNMDSAISVLENIQTQMDKKVEEAKKFKIEVDNAKDNIRKIEEDNRNLELSLNEINEKYSKMNLVSLIEAGNKEIKAKINENIKEINKNKEQIAELTSKAKTIKDLLMNLKKDKTAKEERLENLKTVYDFYSKNLNEIIEYAYEHSDNLEIKSYHNYNLNLSEEEINSEQTYSDLDNSMVFDEIADIDENKNFKDEITFINDEIENSIINNDYAKFVENINNSIDKNEELETEEVVEEEPSINLDDLESTKVFDSIMSPDYSFDEDEEDSEEGFINNENEEINELSDESEVKELDNKDEINIDVEPDFSIEENIEIAEEPEGFINTDLENEINNNLDFSINNNVINTDYDINENTQFDLTTNNRIEEISDLLTDLENTKTKTIELNNIEDRINKVLNEEALEPTGNTLTDIFGNPIKPEDIDETIKQTKKIEEIFVENGVDFNKLKEDEQNYLKQIYDENKFIEIFNILNKHKINVDNIYYSFNIFGEITPVELDIIITKLVNIGQSIESIGIILEKIPRIKKYNLDEAIASFNDEIKNVNITELIMRAKELYNGGSK